MDTVIALGTENTLRKLRARLKKVQLNLETVRTRRALTKRLAETHPNLVLIDVTMPSLSSEEVIRSIREHAPEVPALFIDVARCDVASLRGLVNKPKTSPSQRTGTSRRHGFRHQLPQALFHPDSGRIDAGRVAAFFGLPLARLARSLGRSPQAVHKTPDAESLQDALAVFVRIAAALLSMFGSQQKARSWLNAPNPDLENVRPKQLVERGKPEVIAEMLEDALLLG